MKRTKMSDEQRRIKARDRSRRKRGWRDTIFPATDERLKSFLLDFKDYDRVPEAIIQYPVVDKLIPPDGRWKRKPPKSGDKSDWLCYLVDSPELKQPSLEELLQRGEEIKQKHEETLAVAQKPKAAVAAVVSAQAGSQPYLDFFTAAAEPPVKNAVSEYLSMIGRKGGLIGGRVKSKAKTMAARTNAKLPRKK